MGGGMMERANFAPITTQYQLTTSVGPAGAGTISPATGSYNSGSLTITATANSGYVFSGFSGDLTGATNPQQLQLNGPKSVTANFVAANSGPGVTVSLPGAKVLVPGQTLSGIPVTLTPTNGFHSAVALSWKNTASWPVGLSASFAQSSGVVGENGARGSTTFSITTSAETPPGTYTLAFQEECPVCMPVDLGCGECFLYL